MPSVGRVYGRSGLCLLVALILRLAAGRLGGDEQASLGQDGDLRGNGHVCGQLCGQRKFLRGLSGTGPERGAPTATTVS